MINFGVLEITVMWKNTVTIQLGNSFDHRALPTYYIITSCYIISFNFLAPYEAKFIALQSYCSESLISVSLVTQLISTSGKLVEWTLSISFSLLTRCYLRCLPLLHIATCIKDSWAQCQVPGSRSSWEWAMWYCLGACCWSRTRPII